MTPKTTAVEPAAAIGKVPTNAKRKQPKGGSRKGCPNKSTVAAREALAVFIDGNVVRLQDWLDRIDEKDGALAAYRCFIDVMEYHVPNDELETLARLAAKMAG